MGRAVVCVVLAGLLASCAHRASEDEIAAADDGKCRGYGAATGSPAYVQCRTALETERRADQSRRRAAILASPN